MTILCVKSFFSFSLPVVEISVVLAVSIAFNLAATFLWSSLPAPVGEYRFFCFLSLDTLFFALLIALTGGILNPFILLMIGPVIIAALVLNRPLLLTHLTISIACAILVSIWHYPLPWASAGYAPIPILLKAGWCIALNLAMILTAVYIYLISQESQRLGQALISMEKNLEKEQKTAAIATLTAAFVHELATPLSTIVLIAHELQSAHQKQEDFQLIHQEALTCQAILKKIASGESFTSAPPSQKPVSFQQTLSSIINSMKNARGIDMVFLTEGEAQEEPYLRPSLKLEFAIKNLLQNALIHAHKMVRILLTWQGENVSLVIQDDGQGFSDYVLKHFGSPFIKDRQYQKETHLGMGLFISHTLLSYLGGNLKISNNEGGRCCVLWHKKHKLFQAKHELA